MKMPISQTTYQKLIKNLFDEIYVELEKSILGNGGVVLYEVDLERFYLYPNYQKLTNGGFHKPNFDLFDYETDKDKLKETLLNRLSNKYNIDYEPFKKEVSTWAELENGRKEFNETVFERLITSFSFEPFSGNHTEETLKADYFVNVGYYENFFKETKYSFRGTDKPHLCTPITGGINSGISFYKLIKYNANYGYVKVNNFITTDLIYFYDLYFNENTEFLKSPFHTLLNAFPNIINPFVNLIYELIVYRFLSIEQKIDELTFLTESKMPYFPDTDNSLSEKNVISLIEEIYSFIDSTNFLRIIPSLRTNKKVADLFSKALILVLNNKLPNHDGFKLKIAALYDNEDENKSKKTVLTSSDYKQLDAMYNFSKTTPRANEKFNVSNLAMLFHLLKEQGVIQDFNNSQLALLISILTGRNEQNIGRTLGDVDKLKKYNTKSAQKYTNEVQEVLESILSLLKK